MKTNKKKEQYLLADVLFEMGMDFDVIENVAGVNAQELLLNKINILDFEEDLEHNVEVNQNEDSYQESRHTRTNKRDSNPD